MNAPFSPTHLRLFAASVVLAGMTAIGATSMALAYTAPGSTLGVTQGCSSAASGTSCQLIFHLQDAGGNPEANSTVTLSASGVAGASIQPTTATTNASGNVKGIFSAGTTGCGSATVTASSPPASTQTTIDVPCTGKGSLPAGSAPPPGTPMWPAALAALALLVVASCGVALRRMRVTA